MYMWLVHVLQLDKRHGDGGDLLMEIVKRFLVLYIKSMCMPYTRMHSRVLQWNASRMIFPNTWILFCVHRAVMATT